MNNRFSKFDAISPKRIQEPLKAVADVAVNTIAKIKKQPPKKIFFQLMYFSIGALAVISLIKGGIYLSSARNASGEILGAATSAYSDLNNASQKLSEQNLANASELFASASSNVKLAQDKLSNYKALTYITPHGNSADHILNGAGFLAAAGEKLTSALNIFEEFKVSSKGVETEGFESKLTANKKALIETRDLVNKSSEEFNKVGSVPLDYEGTLQKGKDQVAQLGLVLNKLIGLENLYLSIFGDQKTYLLIFQNYDEERATGGFIGTYGVLKTNHGSISKLKIASIYELDGQINELVAAPGPFQPDIPRWGIRDANWFADFPTSAQKLLYFFEKGDQTADGVIAVTPKIFEDLLNLIGPIELKDYGVTLTAENFQETVQYETSVAYDKQLNQPKKMLADFAPILLDRLTSLPQDQWFTFFQIMQDNLNQRQIQIFSKDADAQKSIDELGFSGRILPTEYDYLNIINSNLGGTKTDLKIEQSAQLKSKILSDGSIINSLTISRKNTADQNNKDYMRIMVPQGSEFISAVGFDDTPIYSSTSKGLRTDPDLVAWDQGQVMSRIFIREESGKTEFAGWLDVAGLSEKIVTVTYMLPFKINNAYSLLLQKQAGSKSYNFTGNLNLGDYSIQYLTSGITKSGDNLNFGSNTNVDDFWGVTITK